MSTLTLFKQKGRALRSHLEASFGQPVTLAQAYEALAAMEGAADWNVLSARLKAQPNGAIAPAGMVLDIQLGLPQHAGLVQRVCRQLLDDAAMRYQSADYRPTLQTDVDEVLALFNVVSTTETGFAEAAYSAVKAAYSAVNAGLKEARLPDGASLFQALSVNLADVLEPYDIPDNVPEWQWVVHHASFRHKDNNVEGGVWDFMVYVGSEESGRIFNDVPDALAPYIGYARKQDLPWILFHQGC